MTTTRRRLTQWPAGLTVKGTEYNSNEVANALSEIVIQRLEDLLTDLKLTLIDEGGYFRGACPIHNGVRDTSLNLYYQQQRTPCRWVCRTRHCEMHFSKSIIGFTRGVLSNRRLQWSKPGDERITHRHAIDYLLKFMNIKIEDVFKYKASPSFRSREERRKFINDVEYLGFIPKEDRFLCTRQQLREQLIIPPSYYLDRGFSEKILNEYDVGIISSAMNLGLSGRVAVPIYSNTKADHVIGLIGRSLYDNCSRCNSFHHPKDTCWDYPKWKCSPKFRDKDYLYNVWKANPFIKDSSCLIVVEGAGDVWRLEEAGIHNSVALMGSQLTDTQNMILDQLHWSKIVVMTDTDEAGESIAEAIRERFDRRGIHYYRVRPDGHDVGEMTVKQVRSHIKPFVESIGVR